NIRHRNYAPPKTPGTNPTEHTPLGLYALRRPRTTRLPSDAESCPLLGRAVAPRFRNRELVEVVPRSCPACSGLEAVATGQSSPPGQMNLSFPPWLAEK